MTNRDDPLARQHGPRVLLDRGLATVQGRGHVLPDFIILGAARAGTTGLLNQLRPHPGVLFCAREELHYFDVEGRWSLGPGSYRRKFPTRDAKKAAKRAGRGPAISGENSPFYLAHPYAPERVKATVPKARLIALLRDPTDRAISHWNWRWNRQQEIRPFAEVVEEELRLLADVPPGGAMPAGTGGLGKATGVKARSAAYARVGNDERTQRNRAYLARGIYQEQLQRWHALFPREQLLIVVSERYYADPAGELARVWSHLGLPPGPPPEPATKNARRNKEALDPAVVARVRAFFQPHNAALEAYLGEPMGWDASPTGE